MVEGGEVTLGHVLLRTILLIGTFTSTTEFKLFPAQLPSAALQVLVPSGPEA